METVFIKQQETQFLFKDCLQKTNAGKQFKTATSRRTENHVFCAKRHYIQTGLDYVLNILTELTCEKKIFFLLWPPYLVDRFEQRCSKKIPNYD